MNTSERISRLALFIIYFWFGALKVFELSPASPMVLTLCEKTLPFIAPETFLVLFGLFEMIVGVLFLIPRFQKPAIILLALHLTTTFMPLVVLPSLTWSSAFVPTMEGQYIIKNLLIIALAVNLSRRSR
jgi:uncharacterized membrane protein YphA (DoxX/SURF4 family)